MRHRAFARSALFFQCPLLALLIFLVVGCGGGSDGLAREAIRGTVSLDGKPLPEGLIQLIPTSSQGGNPSGGSIKDGNFSIEKAQGLVPGEYRVVINSSKREHATANAADEAPGVVNQTGGPKDLIPVRYNANSMLKAEVKAGTSNTFDFPLTAK